MSNERREIQKYQSIDNLLELEEFDQPVVRENEYPKSSYGNYIEDEEKTDVREVLRRIRKHKFLIFSVVTVVTTLVALQMFRTQPMYKASTVLEIGKESSIVLKSEGITLSDDSDPQYMVNINTKMLAFNNPELFEKVVLDLKIDQNPKVLESFQKKPLLPFLSNAPEIIEAKQAPNTNESDEKLRLAPFVAYVQGNTSVEQIKNTRALKISFTDRDPALAAAIAASVANVFIGNSFTNQTEKFTNSVEWLDQSTRELKAKVQASEQALFNYTRENQIYSTEQGPESKSSTLTTSKLTQLHDQFVRTQTERTLKKSLHDQVEAGRITELPEAFSDPKITQFQQQLAALQSQAAQLKVRFGPNNPKILEVQNQINVLTSQIEASRQALVAKLKADYERAVRDEQSLAAALSVAKSSAVNENQASIKYNILKQDVETARGLYTDFLQKTNQAKAQVAEQNSNIKVIQPAATPKSPVGPNRLHIILAGFVLSLGAGIGLAYFIESLDDTIKTLDDVERYAQMPVLGLIPHMSGDSSGYFKRKKNRNQTELSEDSSYLGLEVRQTPEQLSLLQNLDSHSMSGEAYRTLRTSLLLSAAGSPPKTILVTSGQAGEGKSTLVVNTAIALAKLGAKVVIVDCDLRRPSVHNKLGISSSVGVTNYLSSNTKLTSLIQELAIPNLSVIPSGPIPPNPAELLGSQKMKDMLALLSGQFDHVIIDSPPIFNVTDPVVLSALVDGTIMVIRSGKTPRGLVQRSRQELSRSRSRILGAVLNAVDIRNGGYNYYYKYSKYSNN